METAASKWKWPRLLGIALGIYLVHYFLFGYHLISGRVVDEDTGKPIEGAVVLGVWSWKISIGFSTGGIYKTEDTVTGIDGRFFLWGVWNPLMNRWFGGDDGTITAYRRGYTAWDSTAIFMHGPRKDFHWKNGVLLKMEKWREGYSFIQHESFVSLSTRGAKTQRFADAMRWETDKRVEERRRRNAEREKQERGR